MMFIKKKYLYSLAKINTYNRNLIIVSINYDIYEEKIYDIWVCLYIWSLWDYYFNFDFDWNWKPSVLIQFRQKFQSDSIINVYI